MTPKETPDSTGELDRKVTSALLQGPAFDDLQTSESIFAHEEVIRYVLDLDGVVGSTLSM